MFGTTTIEISINENDNKSLSFPNLVLFDVKILHCLDSSLSHIERKRAINCVDIKLKSARCFLGTICAFSVNTLDTTLHAYWQRTQRN